MVFAQIFYLHFYWLLVLYADSQRCDRFCSGVMFADKLSGLSYFLILGTSGILTKFMPSIMMGLYVVSTTTISEFTAAMQRMNVGEKLIIPLSVMFRLFSTIADEFDSVNAAMRMRGVSFGGQH